MKTSMKLAIHHLKMAGIYTRRIATKMMDIPFARIASRKPYRHTVCTVETISNSKLPMTARDAAA